MIVYLDESGDLGFSLNHLGTSRYLALTALVCEDSNANLAVIRAVKRTLENKLSKTIAELKGTHTTLAVKQYFLRKATQNTNWRLYTALANKTAWLQHHRMKYKEEPEKKILYDEIACRLFAQLDFSTPTFYLQIVVDRSKSADDIKFFDKKIMQVLAEKVPAKTRLSIRHRHSYEDPGLQAIDLFCWGISRKYEKADSEWYAAFADRIAVEIEYKF